HSVSVTQYKGSKQGSVNICSLPQLAGAKKVLVCDDICDSGACLSALMSELRQSSSSEFSSATLFYKSTAILKPDFYAKQARGWIVFPWEIDALGEEF
ncbi:MAG: phosphoribosyltransferase family protein, partial [Campylobacter sp.]|nr:phosphoribosyltransferase family protein [Campylobacter sp.]